MTDKKIPVKLKYDTWFDAGNASGEIETDTRTKAGTIIEVDIDTALKLISEGKAERADPLPGV